MFRSTGKKYRISSAGLEKAHAASLPPQARALVDCLYLLQIAHGEGEWILDEEVARWLEHEFGNHAATRQDTWRLFRYYWVNNLDRFIQESA